MENKLCIYAICKNEVERVDKWLENMSEADYIVVLDTGSTDGTYEKLKADPRVTRVEQKTYSPWRFDTPRNDSMKLCPKDANILLCTDFDELFIPGFAAVIKEKWNPEVHKQGKYKYAWNHSANGAPQNIFAYDKLHANCDLLQWKYPIHEILVPNRPLKPEEVCEFDDRVYLHHYQNPNVNRSKSINLLELRVQENPHEPLGWYLLSREYGIIGKEYERGQAELWYRKSIESFKKALTVPEVDNEKIIKLGCMCLLGDLYACVGEYDNALDVYHRIISIDNTYRQPYLGIAEIYNQTGQYNSAVGVVYDAMQKTYQHFDWTETGTVFAEKPYDILAVAYYYLGKYKEGIEMSEKALAFEPNNARILKNYKALQEKFEKKQYSF